MTRARRGARVLVLLAVLAAGTAACDHEGPSPPPVTTPPVPVPPPSTSPPPPPPVTTPPVPVPPPSTSPPPPPPSTTPPPPPATLRIATQFGLAGSRVGDRVGDVEAELGIGLEEQWARGNCTVRLDPGQGIATVDTGGLVQTFVVLNPQVHTTEGVGVGSTYEDVAEAYPKWVAGMTGYTTDYGGRFVPVEISPYAQRPDHSAAGRHLMFELDDDDVVRRYRVGAPPYVFHTEVCSTPE